jgi:dimethylargininase
MFTHAVVRKPGEDFAGGITTSRMGKPIYELLLKQHEAYIKTLEILGLEVIILDALPGYPDAYFVEDTAVVTPDVAVITNPGAETRKGEEKEIETVLSRYRKIVRINPPGTLDGGDVLMVGTHFFIGISERTNTDGAVQLGHILEAYGNTWAAVHVESGLHLKSSVNCVGKNCLLITENFVHQDEFSGYDRIVLKPAEAYAGNILRVNNCLILPGGFPDTRKKLEAIGCDMVALDVSEVRKMDGGVTCLSIRF